MEIENIPKTKQKISRQQRRGKREETQEAHVGHKVLHW